MPLNEEVAWFIYLVLAALFSFCYCIAFGKSTYNKRIFVLACLKLVNIFEKLPKT